MKTKTKVLIAVIALIFVVGVASTSVWALSVINPQATFKVTFLKNTNDVYAKINMTSYISTSSEPIETLDTVVINGFVESKETAFKNQIVVTQIGQVVSYVFEIENTTMADTDNNLIIEPILTAETYDNIVTELLYSTDGINYGSMTEDYAVIQKGETAYLKVECKAVSTSSSNITLDGKLDINFYSELDSENPAK